MAAQSIWMMLALSLLSSTVVAAIVSYFFQKVLQRRALKFDCYRRLLAHRMGQEGFFQAINEVPATFDGNSVVVAAFDRFHEAVTRPENTLVKFEKYYDLLDAIRKDLGIKKLNREQGRVLRQFGLAPNWKPENEQLTTERVGEQ